MRVADLDARANPYVSCEFSLLESGLQHLMAGHSTIALVSDTHGWLDPALKEHLAAADLILHAGDIGSQALLDELNEVAPTVAVRGNIDGGSLRYLPVETVVEIAGKRIALRHIAGSPIRPSQTIRAYVDREQPDVLVVGHSHLFVAGKALGLLWINPGAAGREGFHDVRTAAMLQIDHDGAMQLSRLTLGSRGR